MLKKFHFSLKKGFVILIICCVSKVHGQENKSFGKWQTLTTENEAIARHECSFVGIGSKLDLLGGRGIKPISIFDLNTKKLALLMTTEQRWRNTNYLPKTPK